MELRIIENKKEISDVERCFWSSILFFTSHTHTHTHTHTRKRTRPHIHIAAMGVSE